MSPAHDVHKWENLGFPESLPSFQKLFPDDEACAHYLEGAKWPKGFECPNCHEKGEPFRFEARPTVLRCKSCRSDVSLKAGTVMEGAHTPLTTWFWGAYLISTSTPGISGVQFQRQLGLKRYETAYQILHKLRAAMFRPGRDRFNRRFYPFNAFRSLLGNRRQWRGPDVRGPLQRRLATPHG